MKSQINQIVGILLERSNGSTAQGKVLQILVSVVLSVPAALSKEKID